MHQQAGTFIKGRQEETDVLEKGHMTKGLTFLFQKLSSTLPLRQTKFYSKYELIS